MAVIAAKQRDRIIVITQYRDKAGNDIMVPVIIGAETTAQDNVRITANIAASAYGKQSVKDMIADAIEKENSGKVAVFGANKKIASKLSLRLLQLEQWSGFEALHNITDDNSPVKLDIDKNIKTFQFKKWFAGSKVVDENGESLVVYQLSVGDVLYKLVTSEKGDLRSFYSNKKATNEVTEPNGSSASSKSPYNNIY